MRTTLDLDDTVLGQLRARQRIEGKTLGELASELLAQALHETTDVAPRPLSWSSQPMGARVDLDDRDALAQLLDDA